MDIEKIVAIMFKKTNPNDSSETTAEFVCEEDFKTNKRENFEALIRELLSGDYKPADGVTMSFLTDYTFTDNIGLAGSN